MTDLPTGTTFRRKCCLSKAVPCSYPNRTQTKCGLKVPLRDYHFMELQTESAFSKKGRASMYNVHQYNVFPQIWPRTVRFSWLPFLYVYTGESTTNIDLVIGFLSRFVQYIRLSRNPSRYWKLHVAIYTIDVN